MLDLKVIVLGLRGFPDVQGGVEKHCEQLYPRLKKFNCDIIVFARKSYVKGLKEWKGIKFISFWVPKQKHLEAFFHTFFGAILSKLKSPDILHIHAIGPAFFTPLAKLLGMKVIVTHHGPDYKRKKWGRFAKFVLKLGEYLAVKFADKMIVISKEIKNMLERKYRRYGLEYIPNGIFLPEIISTGKTLQKFGLIPKRYIFTASRFVPEKGLHDLIDAYRKIPSPPFKLVIAGDADHETDYSRKIKKMAKETEGVVLIGFISGRPLQELYSNAGLFVLPSYYEGLPIALLEALSYGLPVLVSDIPAHREFPLPEFRFFKPGKIGQLAKKMIELFKLGISEEEKERMKIVLLRDYNWDKIARDTFEVYKNVMGKLA